MTVTSESGTRAFAQFFDEARAGHSVADHDETSALHRG